MRRLLLGLTLAAAAVPVGAGIRALAFDTPPASSCLIQTDKNVAVKPAAGRTVLCGLDIGSKTVKLSVVSMVRGQNPTIRDERQCRRTLGMGALVFDSTTSTAKPLPDATIGQLSDTIDEFLHICQRDGGTLVAAGATQWARDATNMPDVIARVRASTGLVITTLTPAQEADFAYVAASVGTPGRFVLDPGSNSVELAWQLKGSPAISSVLIKYGYVRGAVNEIEPAADFAKARAAYQVKAKAQIEEALAAMTPPTSLASLRGLMRAGQIGPEIVTLGQDGAVYLSARRLLTRADGTWITEAATVNSVIAGQPQSSDPVFGPLAAPPITPAELSTFFGRLSAADFKALTTEPVRTLYGQKGLAVPLLVDLLFRELGATKLVMVPQEGATGHILARIGNR